MIKNAVRVDRGSRLLVPGKGDQYVRTRAVQRVFTPRMVKPVKFRFGEQRRSNKNFCACACCLLVLSAVRSSAMQRCCCACCVALGPLLYRFF